MSDLTLFFPQSVDEYNAPRWSLYRPDLHDETLREIGVELPFEPVPAEVEWVCQCCGNRRKMGVAMVGRPGSLDTADVRFVPETEDNKPVRCGEVVELRKVQDTRPYMPSGGPAKVIGPKQQNSYRYRVLETFEGPCPGHYDPRDSYQHHNDWRVTDLEWEMEARQQMAFLSLLPAWRAFRQFQRSGDYQTGTPFPPEWMGGDFTVMSLSHRMRTVERVLGEVMNRMSVAGHALDIHGIQYW